MSSTRHSTHISRRRPLWHQRLRRSQDRHLHGRTIIKLCVVKRAFQEQYHKCQHQRTLHFRISWLSLHSYTILYYHSSILAFTDDISSQRGITTALNFGHLTPMLGAILYNDFNFNEPTYKQVNALPMGISMDTFWRTTISRRTRWFSTRNTLTADAISPPIEWRSRGYSTSVTSSITTVSTLIFRTKVVY